ncbi:Uma2 family endonuclease [Dyadobacter pollutisoli]|uniref:Uma2 family endonuclease n=1 Tax=Dyadobacter pollutisoli TaxID=2910158 RepID=A0A9E8N4C3_9BACT|nr:Uma2 family endonuclease [Dyadobacter pollutisoli]WAC09470.1 Uma2 family endonuclease [Dyadobacter pollutisoli]
MSTTIKDINQLDLNGTYTYADYLLWRLEERLELIKGKIFKMSPAPNVRHQKISGKLHLEMGMFFKNHYCQVFYAPFDVRLHKKNSQSSDTKIYTVVQPDLCVICDEGKLDEKGCLGAPDLIVEILSPGNSRKEMDIKFELYEESGVREYWLVEPAENAVFAYVLNEHGTYIGLKPAINILQSAIFPDLKIDLEQIFK